MINNRYKLEKELGKGSFATVYKGTDTKLSVPVAIKFMELAFHPLFQIECKVFNLVSGRSHFPKLYWSGEYEKNFYLIMQLLDTSLSTHLTTESFPLASILSLSLEILSALETLHSLGYIHRDIKPDNILLSPTHDCFYLIDFGLCKNYIDSATKHHAPMREDTAFKGNLIFCSKNILSGISASRRDDIESLFLLVIYLVKKELPWINEKKNLECMIGRRSSVNFNHFMQGLPLELFEIFNYTQTLNYYQTPNYEWIREKLLGLRGQLNVQPERVKKGTASPEKGKRNSVVRKEAKRSRTTAARRRVSKVECETVVIPPPDFSKQFREKIRKMRMMKGG